MKWVIACPARSAWPTRWGWARPSKRADHPSAVALGRAHRVLILLPETLQHQWLVEMLRRFNLHFSLFDEERCIEAFADAENLSRPNSW